MKICLINPDFIPNRGSGQAVYAQKIALGLTRHHEVTVICALKGDSPLEERVENLRIVRLPERIKDPSQWIGFGFQVAKFLRSWEKKSEFDIIHFLDAHVAYAYRGQFVATLHQSFKQRMRGDRGLPYSSSWFNLAKRYPYYHFSRHLECLALKKANAVISVSDTIRREFIENYNIEPPAVRRVYNGIDPSFFKPVDATNLRKKYNLTNEKVVLYIGFSTPRKGVETLTNAIGCMKHKNVKLIIVGKWEAGYRNKVFKKIGGIRHKIIEAGYVPDHEIPAHYSLADIFVLPSLLEGFGFPLVEAMACGTPVIGSNVGAIPEIIGDCGIVVTPQKPAELAHSMDKLLSDQQLQDRLIQKGIKRVLTHFTYSDMIENTIDFYLDNLKPAHNQGTKDEN
ncbi:hypothetical protein DSCO28_00710 [Desulfosarcina ovata subsp. sediminis]|uniref:Glycosyl transferase family 1 n=1 Tax=Desulfosarcina ovata subsp. sediminis TaxID=885957 RepID=A0A5K7ZGV4_9BACT|nr:glycosyltransferase family 4 protein [Desulfosarcina ovata]BBO79505.1 hypothetical protein DSCO28_00710 [Desulfosarcina ovata subsp. sediminis]